jgi:hypothetical protein
MVELNCHITQEMETHYLAITRPNDHLAIQLMTCFVFEFIFIVACSMYCKRCDYLETGDTALQL